MDRLGLQYLYSSQSRRREILKFRIVAKVFGDHYLSKDVMIIHSNERKGHYGESWSPTSWSEKPFIEDLYMSYNYS